MTESSKKITNHKVATNDNPESSKKMTKHQANFGKKTTESGEKTKRSLAEIEKIWVDTMLGVSTELDISFPKYAKCTRQNKNHDRLAAPYFFRIENDVAQIVSADEITEEIYSIGRKIYGGLQLTRRQAGDLQRAWAAVAPDISWPIPVAWHSQKGIAFQRLNFDNNPKINIDALAKKAPFFYKTLRRIENGLALCQRIGSMLDPNASRKQVIWLFGAHDVGKSAIQAMIQNLFGYGHYVVMSATGRKSVFWMSSLAGKRLVTESEADPAYLRTEEFRAVTGDDVVQVEQKYQMPRTITLDAIFFFFSNHAPEVANLGEIRNRVIPCWIAPLDPKDVIDAAEVQKMLLAERETVLSYCWNVYSQMRTKTIEFDASRMDSAIEAYEQDMVDIFERFFVQDPAGFVTAADFGKVMSYSRVTAAEKKQFRRYLETSHSVPYQYASARVGGVKCKILKGISRIPGDLMSQ